MTEQNEPAQAGVRKTFREREALLDLHMQDEDADQYIFTRRECVKMAKGMPHIKHWLIEEMLWRMGYNEGVIGYAANEFRELADELDAKAAELRAEVQGGDTGV